MKIVELLNILAQVPGDEDVSSITIDTHGVKIVQVGDLSPIDPPVDPPSDNGG